jgi:hypothetical protein
MTETPEAPVDYGTPRYVTAGAFLPILRPGGGKRLDIYGPGKPVPASAMTDAQVAHFLDKGLIEHVDAHGNVDKWRCVEALTAIIACCADEEGSESWGRPRIAEAVRRKGFKFQNRTLGIAIKMFKSDWKSGDPLPSERG